ncbi:MAG: chorismate synthase [Lachnospiraceae bacterium]|nr:chorismate synthase [Lachnospiraceae bacterium]
MAGSIFGKHFTIQTWGESHGKAIGVVIDGCPAGLALCEEDLMKYLNRRKPGQSRFATPRKEADEVEILSGVFEGRTTGTPISLIVHNTSQKSRDYSEIASYYRPGHADYTFDEKYGFRDYRGGGRSSGRETIGRVAGGAVAAKILQELGITVTAYTKSIGPVTIEYSRFDPELITSTPTGMPDPEADKKAQTYLEECLKETDSAGGVVECVVKNCFAGIGEPVFDKLDARLGQALFSIGAVKAVEIGDGIKAAASKGSENNDAFVLDGRQIVKPSNHAGGILGGISDGSDIICRAYFKPTPSIYKEQLTVNKDLQEIPVHIKGRHDPIIVPRAVVVVECMTALTLVDLLLENMGARMDYLKSLYNRKQ